ncbi:hypothetical protein AMTRI_Chr03g49210 [Amborella trichopoda]
MHLHTKTWDSAAVLHFVKHLIRRLNFSIDITPSNGPQITHFKIGIMHISIYSTSPFLRLTCSNMRSLRQTNIFFFSLESSAYHNYIRFSSLIATPTQMHHGAVTISLVIREWKAHKNLCHKLLALGIQGDQGFKP